MGYLAAKTLHILFVMAWMAAVFYLPRILVNIAETAGEVPAVRERLYLMGRRLYRFGHVMFGISLVLGLMLWLHYGISGAWLRAKLTLVAVLLAYYIVCGRWLKRAAQGGALPSPTTLRWINELPLVIVIPIIYLVLAKRIGL